MKVMAGLCSYVTFIWESPFLFEFGYIDLSQQTDKLLFEVTVRAAPCLPLWGRWQPEGLTEEVFGVAFCEKVKQMQ